MVMAPPPPTPPPCLLDDRFGIPAPPREPGEQTSGGVLPGWPLVGLIALALMLGVAIVAGVCG